MGNLDTVALALADQLAECLCEQLALTVGGPVCSCCVTIGPPVVDCCACPDRGSEGTAWVRVVRTYPSGGRFPAQQVEPVNCPSGWAIELELGAVRCSRQYTEDGSSPTCEQMREDAERVLDDAAAMRRALLCCFTGDKRLVINQWQSHGPDGFCVGGFMAVTVAFTDAFPADLPPIGAPPPDALDALDGVEVDP